jgi:hypothetical protein
MRLFRNKSPNDTGVKTHFCAHGATEGCSQVRLEMATEQMFCGTSGEKALGWMWKSLRPGESEPDLKTNRFIGGKGLRSSNIFNMFCEGRAAAMECLVRRSEVSFVFH